jgi:hypothetical protein
MRQNLPCNSLMEFVFFPVQILSTRGFAQPLSSESKSLTNLPRRYGGGFISCICMVTRYLQIAMPEPPNELWQATCLASTLHGVSE